VAQSFAEDGREGSSPRFASRLWRWASAEAVIAVAVVGVAIAPSAATKAEGARSGFKILPPVTTVAPTAPAAPASPAATHPLAGKIVVLDPGHNGDNYAAPGIIDQQVWNGREWENCNTTGTETDGGYTEALFNWNVANDAAGDLEAEGATVVLTRNSNTGVGPCVTQRAAIANQAHAVVAVAIHADGGPAGGRGVAILEPVADGINNAVVGSSANLAQTVLGAFRAATGEPDSSYDGVNGLQPRDDLAGLNLTTIPNVLIECANMRNSTDASLLVTKAWQQAAAQGIANGITAFVTGTPGH
jgi:N-acetylmuramoyl-L-alanine amidase